jgi:ATP-dependent DNA helicase PIF1
MNLLFNMAIAAYYFQKRWELFYEHVLKKKLKVKDYWWRYEWQFRGSSHVHCFFWLEDAPAVESLDLDNPESISTFVEFWDPLVSAWNPSQEEPKATIHPSARDPLRMDYNFRDLAQLLNRVQQHTVCTPSYCLRRPKGALKDLPLICRFKYPQALANATTITIDDRKMPKIFPKRNDPLLNLYNPTQILGWQANVDFSPLTSMQGVQNYIAKYCSNTEKKSEDYSQIFNTVISSAHLDEEVPSRVVFQKMFSSLIVEQDWSAQECCHLLLGCHLYKTIRQFKSLNLSAKRLNGFQPLDAMMDDEDLALIQKSWIDHYEERHLHSNRDEVCDTSLIKIFRRYDFKKDKFVHRPRAPPRVVMVWPNYIPDKSDPEMYDNWCRAKLQLHHPYNDDFQNLRFVDDEDVGWSGAYAKCLEEGHTHDVAG